MDVQHHALYFAAMVDRMGFACYRALDISGFYCSGVWLFLYLRRRWNGANGTWKGGCWHAKGQPGVRPTFCAFHVVVFPSRTLCQYIHVQQCGFTFARCPLCWDSTDGIGNNITSTLQTLVTIIFDILFVRAHSNGLIPNFWMVWRLFLSEQADYEAVVLGLWYANKLKHSKNFPFGDLEIRTKTDGQLVLLVRTGGAKKDKV